MSLLNIARNTADIIGLPEIDQVVGNPEKDVRQLLALIRRGGNTLSQTTNSDGGSWSVLERIHEFQTTANETEYDLPVDYSRLIIGTAWQKEKYWLMRGSATPQQWESVRNRQAKTPYNIFRILRTQSGGAVGQVGQGQAPNLLRKFTLEPAAGEAITLVFEYVSKFLWISSDGSIYKQVPDADSDESLLGDDIHVLDAVWRFRKAKSLDYAADLAEFELVRDRALVQDNATESIPVGYSRRAGANKDESDVEWACT